MAREEKSRLDVLLVERGLSASREQAQRRILAGEVTIDGMPADKPGTRVKVSAEIAVKASATEYVGRGAYKLLTALEAFSIIIEGRVAVDVGASTGGFTDLLLQRGARHVHAIDVGHGQLAWKIRSDPRVTVREKYNARNLAPADFEPRPSLGVVDVSFISLELILPPLWQSLVGPRDVVCLIKPQFELGRADIPRGGVVRDESLRERAILKIRDFTRRHLPDALWRGVVPSQIEGADGNQEYLAWLSELSA